MGTPSDTARLWPLRVSASRRRASESSVRPWKNRESLGAVNEITTVRSAITRINSISVKADDA